MNAFNPVSPAKRNIFTPNKRLMSVSPVKYEVFNKDGVDQSRERYQELGFQQEVR